MSDWLPWALLPLALCTGLWLGVRIAQEQTRIRGEAALRTYRDLQRRDPWAFIVATERLIRHATGLPDAPQPKDNA